MNWQDFLNNLTSVVEERESAKTRECYCGKDDYLISTRDSVKVLLKPVGKCKEECVLASIISCKLDLKAGKKCNQKPLSYS
ncbi:MAG: hypothetical protein ACFFD4_38700 [Candidatus Odinarchaeota archaeon]